LICSDDLAVKPDTKITLLLQELEGEASGNH
jgi:hypothetical protein